MTSSTRLMIFTTSPVPSVVKIEFILGKRLGARHLAAVLDFTKHILPAPSDKDIGAATAYGMQQKNARPGPAAVALRDLRSC